MRGALLALVLGVILSAAGYGVAAWAQKPPAPPGQDPCSHGNSQKPCRPDPQPDHGADCDPHGKGPGGRNEDHCLDDTTTTTTTDTTTTETTTTTTPPPPPPTTTTTTTTGETTTSTTPTTPETTTVPPNDSTTIETTTTPSPPTSTPPTTTPPPSRTGSPPKSRKPDSPPTKLRCPQSMRIYQGKCHGIVRGNG